MRASVNAERPDLLRCELGAWHNFTLNIRSSAAALIERMASRGRTSGFQMGAEHRTKIGNSKILKHLIEHAEGSRDMSSTQVTAALGLLKKVMPDMTETMIKGDENAPVAFSAVALAPLTVNAADD
jgi:hypothetical protein